MYINQARLFDLNDLMQMDQKEGIDWETQGYVLELSRALYCEKEDKTMCIKGEDTEQGH